MKIQTTKVFAKIQEGIDGGFSTISLQGSSRSSKTYNTLIWIILYCLRCPHTRLSIVRATLPALRGSVFVDFKDILLRMDLWDDVRLHKSEMVYQFSNGSWVEFFSTDSEQKLRGRKRDILFVNEANELSFIEWQQLKIRTTRLSIIDYNPSFSDEHWIHSVNQDPRTFHFITTYKDNPFLEQAIIAEIESLQSKSKTLWQVYGLGLQAVIEGLVFKEFEMVDEIPELARKHHLRGMDFGFANDPTAIVDVYPAGDTLYLDELCYRTEMLTSDIVALLKINGAGVVTISESADPRLVQEIYRAGVNIHPVQKFAGSIEAGISKLSEYHLKVTKRSYNLIKELRNYTYAQDKEGRWLNRPIDAYNHCIDAIRYVAMMKLMGGRRQPVNIARLASKAY